MLDTLNPIVEYAASKKITLGVETRYLYEEIPSEPEFEGLFKHYEGSTLRYWHDTGHAHTRQFLGFSNHEEFLKRMEPYLAGWHIHDVRRPDGDHKAPGTADMDFNFLRPFLAKPAIRVLELSPHTKSAQIRKGLAFMKKILQRREGELPLTFQ